MRIIFKFSMNKMDYLYSSYNSLLHNQSCCYFPQNILNCVLARTEGNFEFSYEKYKLEQFMYIRWISDGN